jgi:hypothetical protein
MLSLDPVEVDTIANTKRDFIAVELESLTLAVILSHFYIPCTVWEFLCLVLYLVQLCCC